MRIYAYVNVLAFPLARPLGLFLRQRDHILEKPTRVALLEGQAVSQVAGSGDDAGQFSGHILVMTKEGGLFAAGDNSYGQLGIGASSSSDYNSAQGAIILRG